MDLGLHGRRALVTGASRGIGRAVARRLAAEGCALHLAARSKEDLDAVANELVRSHGVPVRVLPVDLSDRDAAERLAQQASDADILVNNAGAIPAGSLDMVDDARWRQAFELKPVGDVTLCRAMYAQLKERGRGAIVLVGGVAGERPVPGYVAGTVCNAAVMALGRALGGSSLTDGSHVVTVNPGAVLTDRIEAILQQKAADLFGDPQRWRELTSHLPGGRPAAPEEIADVITFLASERARWISGTVVTVDGGFCAANPGV